MSLGLRDMSATCGQAQLTQQEQTYVIRWKARA